MRKPNPWWLAVAGYTALTFYVSVIPVKQALPVDHFDKVVHFFQYLLLAWLLVQATRASRLQVPGLRRTIWGAATSYGLLIELVQAMLPWRSAELLDMVMNGLGAAVGTLLFSFRSTEGK